MTRRKGDADIMYVTVPWDHLPAALQEGLRAFGIDAGKHVRFTKRAPVADEVLRERFAMLLVEYSGKRTRAFAALAAEFGYCERHVRRRINGGQAD